MKDIYILLTKSDTLFSKAIYKITRAEYTHASISLDRELTKLYSFGRKYRYSMLPAGFVHEDINRGVMGSSDTMKCALYRIRISERSYRRLETESGTWKPTEKAIATILWVFLCVCSVLQGSEKIISSVPSLCPVCSLSQVQWKEMLWEHHPSPIQATCRGYQKPAVSSKAQWRSSGLEHSQSAYYLLFFGL